MTWQAKREEVRAKVEFGYLEGETCWRNGCQGVIREREVEGCSCHISPPCSACTTPREYCPECDWRAKDEGEHMNGYIQNLSKPFQWEERPLDPRKIDYRSKSHTNSSMIKEGVYPEGTTRDDVEKLVRGTFGGRFEYFSNGRFKYVAYTD